MSPSLQRVLLLSVVIVLGAAGPAGAYTAGACPPTGAGRCETWSAVVDTPATQAGSRSDQFTATVLTSATTTFHVGKDVEINPDDPFAAAGRSLVVAYSSATGQRLWMVPRSDDVYLNTTDAALSPDGSRLYVTGGAYNAFPVAATDARLTTTAYDTSDGRVLWSTAWDGRPDATDNGKKVVVSPDGAQVFATGVTTSAAGDLDYVTVAYDTADGHVLWSHVYAGVGLGGSDAPFGLAVAPDGSHLYVTGSSAGEVEYDADYATVAYALRPTEADRPGQGRGPKPRPEEHPGGGPTAQGQPAGSVAWVARYDGVGQDKSDRANAVAVDPDSSRVYVTGDSYAGRGGSDYDYATVAYDAASGEQLWQARYAGSRGGFNSARTVLAGGGRVLVTGQSNGPTDADENDAAVVAYTASTGAQAWVAAVAPPQHDDYGRDLALAPDGQTAYLVSTHTPVIRYTSLARLSLTAYDMASGGIRWQTDLDAGSGNALRGVAVAATPDGASVVVAGDVTRSVNPVGARNQNVYDALVAAFPA